jgi:hypothetical protein
MLRIFLLLSLFLSFFIVNDTSARAAVGTVTSFTLINADTEGDLFQLTNGAILDYSTLPTRNLNVRANTSGTIGSVVFSGEMNRTENSPPYSMVGDSNGNYAAWTPTVGVHTITAKTYAKDDGGGAVGHTFTVTFTVTEGAPPTPTSTPVPTNTSVATSTPLPTSTPTTVPTSTPTIASTAVPTSTPTEVPTTQEPSTPTQVPSTPTVAATSTPTSVPTTGCDAYPHTRVVNVSTTAQLDSAVANAQAGDLIKIADGRYVDTFASTRLGTAENRITVCGGPNAVLGPSSFTGNIFHMTNIRYWTFVGFTTTNGNIGFFMENVHHNVFYDLEIKNLGQAGIIVRKNSTFNLFDSLWIHNTGKTNFHAAEGIYIGTYYGNWTNGVPDVTSDNTIQNSYFGPNVGSEAVDIKQAAVRNKVLYNTFDGTGSNATIRDNIEGAWVDIQGSDNLVEGNVGVNPTGLSAERHGFFVFSPSSVPDSGARNVFRNNQATVNDSGYGFKVSGNNANTNIVECNNTVVGAEKGFSSIPCR